MNDFVQSIVNIVGQVWFFVLPIVLFYIFRDLWLESRRGAYIQGLKWVILDIRIPKEVEKTMKAMETIFAGLHAIHAKVKFLEKWWQGKVQLGCSFEIISLGGEVHFMIGVSEQYQSLIETQIYAQYRAAEISVVDDYTKMLPQSLPNTAYNCTGGEIILTKEDAYPIRTYVEFEDARAPVETRIDPLASLLEFMASLTPEEKVFIHILITPIGDEWKTEGEKLLAKLSGKKAKDESGIITHGINALFEGVIFLFEIFFDMIGTLFGAGGGGEAETKEKKEEKKELTGLEKTAMEAIQQNITKLGFNTGIRFFYVAPHEVFQKTRGTEIMAGFKQFNTMHLNGFKGNSDRATKEGKYIFKKRTERYRKIMFYEVFKKRTKVPMKTFTFNTEELATIYHFPGSGVTAPTLPRVGATRGQPPINLPI